MEKEAAAAAIKINSPSPVQLFTMEHNKEKEMIGKSTTYLSFLSITHHDYHSQELWYEYVWKALHTNHLR